MFAVERDVNNTQMQGSQHKSRAERGKEEKAKTSG
jgi:hypothetical protein